jgi:tetratricopeptide (TPR) repeat protein
VLCPGPSLRRAALALGVFVGLALPALRVEGAPSLWQRAKNPGEARLLVALERRLDEIALAAREPDTAERIARAGVALIELARIDNPADPRLAFMMARVLLAADVNRNIDAERLLEHAVAELPVSPLLAKAWLELGLLRALRGDPAAAVDAESRALELALDPDQRALAFCRRAASEAELRALPRAESDYRTAAETARDPALQALARFGRGLVLERQGDLPSAYAVLEQGLTIALPISAYATDELLELPGAFFSPSYERFYVGALLAMTRARVEQDPRARRIELEQAVADWDAYLLAARADEVWVPNATGHRQRCVRELSRLPRARRKSTNP